MENAKIFGIGLSKTGTTSLYAALATLGYRSITNRHLRMNGVQDWFSGEFSEDYLEGIDSATDLPVAAYYRELDLRYPGSKFILTVRPVDGWLASAEKQFRQTAPTRTAGSFSRDTHLATYGITVFHKERFRRLFSEHMTGAKSYFSDRPQDFLVLDLFSGDGWPELCHFLGKDIPDVEFPNVRPGFEAYPDPEKSFPAYSYPPAKAPSKPVAYRALRKIGKLMRE